MPVPAEIEIRAREAISYQALRDYFAKFDGRKTVGTSMTDSSCPLALIVANAVGPGYTVKVSTKYVIIHIEHDEKDVLGIPLEPWQRIVVGRVDWGGLKRRIRCGVMRSILADIDLSADAKEQAGA